MLESTLTALPQALKDSFPHDEIWTPPEALVSLLPYLNRDTVLWDCAPGSGVLQSHLRSAGHEVVDWRGDFLQDEPPTYDMIVSNPPYSKAHLFIERANELNKRWAMLLPITKLGAKRCRDHLEGVEIIFPERRINFTGGSGVWFYCAWFMMNLNLGRQLIFT